MRPLIVNDTSFKISEKFLKDCVKKISTTLSEKSILDTLNADKELTLVFLDKLAAKKLNWQYRQKDHATDVLSFESGDPESIGELVFCPEVLETQAKDHKQTFDQELGLMLLHGVLHLLGFDHENGGEEEKKMMSLQDEVFKNLFSVKAKAVKKAVVSSAKLVAKTPVKAKAKAPLKSPAKTAVKSARK